MEGKKEAPSFADAVGGKTSPATDADEGPSEKQLMAAEMFSKAIKGGDPKAIHRAMKTLLKYCE